MAGEQPKKITGGAFGRYMAENRAALLKETPGQAATASIKLGSQRYKALSSSETAKYQKMYEGAKAKYEKDLAAFLAAGGEMKAKKSKKDKKEKKSVDPNKPKQPAGGAYGCFLAKNRAAFMKEVGPGKAVTAVSKLASEKWKVIADAEKQPFQKEFEKKQAAYKKAMETYVPPVVEGEDEEEDEEKEDESEENEDQEEDDGSKKRKATSKADAPAAKKGKTVGSGEVESEAKKLGFLAKLKALAENPKVKSSPAEILAELQKQNGSVVAVKKALLGA